MLLQSNREKNERIENERQKELKEVTKKCPKRVRCNGKQKEGEKEANKQRNKKVQQQRDKKM